MTTNPPANLDDYSQLLTGMLGDQCEAFRSGLRLCHSSDPHLGSVWPEVVLRTRLTLILQRELLTSEPYLLLAPPEL